MKKRCLETWGEGMTKGDGCASHAIGNTNKPTKTNHHNNKLEATDVVGP